MKRVIYDFGANTGNDIPYYLKKADVVLSHPLIFCGSRFATRGMNLHS